MTFSYQGIFGYDISTYQDSPDIPGTVDFVKMAGTGARFCIFRASIGNAADVDFAKYWQNSKGHLLTAVYHYYSIASGYSPQVQAARLWNTIKADPPYRVFLDCEEGVAGDWRKWYDFIEEFKRLSGFTNERIGIYTGYYIWNTVLTGATTAQRDYFKKYLLWLAWYHPDPFHPNYSVILTPSPWTQYEILQSGTPAIGISAGVESREIDYNQLNGGDDKLQMIFGGGTTTPPPDNGGSMGTIGTHKGVVFADTNIKRMDNGTVLYVAKPNDVVWGVWNTAKTDMINFDHYYKANGTRVELGTMCKAVTQNMTVTVQTEPATPTEPPPSGVTFPDKLETTQTLIQGTQQATYKGTLTKQ